jgi:hypothetical protein
MQKLQIKEEITAVAALLALGMLAVLATNGNAVYGQTNVVYEQTSKASFAACMWINDWRFDKATVGNCALTASGLGFGGGAYIGAIRYLTTFNALSAVRWSVWGFVVITA